MLGDLAVDALPGVGWSLRNKLADTGITHVRQVGVVFLLASSVGPGGVCVLLETGFQPFQKAVPGKRLPESGVFGKPFSGSQ